MFTGSVSGGKSILKHTSQKFMMPALELGGKDAAYVHKDADIQYAVDTIVDGAMFNALNFAGSGLLAWVAIHDRRAGFIILEVVWALVSLPPLYRALTGPANAPAR